MKYNGYVNTGIEGEFGTVYYNEETGEMSEERDYRYLVNPTVDTSIIIVETMLKRYHENKDVITGTITRSKAA